MPSEDGIVPDISKLVFAFNVSKLLKLPKLDGRGPLKEFPLITNDVSDSSFPIDGDNVPTTPLEDKSTSLTSTPEHTIPVQLHTELSGTLPVHDHPLKDVNEFVLAAAATLHIASSLSVAVGAAVGDTVGFGDGMAVGQPEGCPEG